MSKTSKGQLVAALRWKGTQLGMLLHPLTHVIYRDDLTTADFLPSKNATVIFISEADIVSGEGYRRRLVKFRHSSKNSSSPEVKRLIVMVQNTSLTEKYFNSLQKFISIDLCLTMIPIQSLQDTANLLSHMVASETRINSNPLRVKLRRQYNPDLQLLQSLNSAVPGLGEEKAQTLLMHYGSFQALSLASLEALEPVVGKPAGASIHKFFNGAA